MGKRIRYSKEVRERAIRLVEECRSAHDSDWAAMRSIAEKIGCTPERLRSWCRQQDIDVGRVAGKTTKELQDHKELLRENREPKRANEIFRKAAAFFAQTELGRGQK